MEENESPLIGQKEIAEQVFGRSVNWFKDNLRFSKKFMQNVPNKTPNAYRPTYLRSDAERFKRLNDWY